MKKHSEEYILQKTLLLAKTWQEEIQDQEISDFQNKLKKIIVDKKSIYFLIHLLDNCFQSTNKKLISKKIEKMFTENEVPSFFNFSEKSLIRLFLLAGKHFPNISIPQIIEQVQEQTSDAVFIKDSNHLIDLLKKRKKAGIQSNVNLIGEIVLGEHEAVLKLEEYINALKKPDIRYLSIKLSNLYSQIETISFEHSVSILIYRLTTLYKEAKENLYLNNQDEKQYKFINLDMEEYRDVELTVHVFIKTMEQDLFFDLHAGIVLQAYLPDSFFWYKTLLLWAKERVQRGGAPIKVRLVKGANLAMERIDASLNGWELTTYSSKQETDSNFKRILDIALTTENISAVNIGIASHNLFDLAYAKTLLNTREIKNGFSFEMLEGMANTALNIFKDDPMVLYTPISEEDKFISAISYLVRRLDEISNPENFLSHSFNLDQSWDLLEKQFINSFNDMNNISSVPNRKETRQYQFFSFDKTSFVTKKFENDSITDFSLLSNRNWAKNIHSKWKSHKVFVNLNPRKDREIRLVKNNAFGDFIGQVEIADAEDMQHALKEVSSSEWLSYDQEKCHKILAKASILFQENRDDLIGVMVSETGKTITEADVEVSEAIDFLEYYPYTLKDFDYSAKGVGVVISPWNFPVAIPLGGVVSGLAGGNTILFKPSSQAILCGYLICQYLWKAGVPKSALHFFPSSSSIFQKEILSYRELKFIIFTGSTEVALKIKNFRKDVPLYAETGGKNTTIVTNNADKDQAIKNIIYSAFGHSGQKCSATSILLLEKEIFEDESFKKKLIDAVRSVYVGDTWDLKNKIGPMVSLPDKTLEKALKTLDKNEYWLVPPKIDILNPKIIYPSIKWNVETDSYSFNTELFGPVLSVVSYTGGIKEAVKIANLPGFGLTGAIESLDKSEIAYWKENLIAGNIYINRPSTGAIVQRQAFGGYRKSSIGAGIKAGGPNYALQFVEIKPKINFELIDVPTFYQEFLKNIQDHSIWKEKIDLNKLSYSLNSYKKNYDTYFSKEWDLSNIIGEHNVLKYRTFEKIIIRITTKDNLTDILMCVSACLVINCPFELNFESKCDSYEFFEGLPNYFPSIKIQNLFDTDEELIKQLNYGIRIRSMSKESISEELLDSTSKQGYYICSEKPSENGRLELLNYLQEQSISNRYHRYGNLGV